MSEEKQPIIIVIANEKGGSGKSTVTTHIIFGLIHKGLSVGCIDLDVRQQTLTHFLQNRVFWSQKNNLPLAIPHYGKLNIDSDNKNSLHAVETNDIDQTIQRLVNKQCDVIVIDTPGTYSDINFYVHTLADILVTPLNDSFIDLDLLARFDPDTQKFATLSVYSEMVLEAKKQKIKNQQGTLDWVVVRNRFDTTKGKKTSKHKISSRLEELERRLAFRVINGLGDRSIFKDLYLSGQVISDVKENKNQLAARQELRNLLRGLNLTITSHETDENDNQDLIEDESESDMIE